MTGFGSASAAVDGEQLSVELRVVNQKFIEVKLRLPRELGNLEAEVQQAVKARLSRGAVDVQVHRRCLNGNSEVSIDLPLAREYARAYGELQLSLGVSDPLSAQVLFQAQGIIRLQERPAAAQPVRQALLEALGEALTQVVAMRTKEGEALHRDLTTRLALLRQLAAGIATEVPRALAEHRRRIQARVAELLHAPPDPGRLELEVALLAERSDIAEELTRFDSHLSQFAELLGGDGPAGRRLDFLTQELHREATTIGNKSQSAAVAKLVIELKTEVERIREQVQNVE